MGIGTSHRDRCERERDGDMPSPRIVTARATETRHRRSARAEDGWQRNAPSRYAKRRAGTIPADLSDRRCAVAPQTRRNLIALTSHPRGERTAPFVRNAPARRRRARAPPPSSSKLYFAATTESDRPNFFPAQTTKRHETEGAGPDHRAPQRRFYCSIPPRPRAPAPTAHPAPATRLSSFADHPNDPQGRAGGQRRRIQ